MLQEVKILDFTFNFVHFEIPFQIKIKCSNLNIKKKCMSSQRLSTNFCLIEIMQNCRCKPDVEQSPHNCK